jgi:NAD(P)-dependent dehydrogenase (short-subunit alcohol dehydrogenase family)
MTTAPAVSVGQRDPELPGQIVVVIGGSSGIGLETARRARTEGADVILTGRNPDRLKAAAAELGALSSSAFDATDPAALDGFFNDLPETIDHVMVTGPGPYYANVADLDRDRAHRIAAGFVDSPLSASLLGDDIEARRAELRATLPIGRVVGPADIAALAVHLMINTAITGGSYDIDGGQQLLTSG